MQEQEWYEIEAAEAGEKLNTDLDRGLSAEEAEKRLEEYGPNALREPPSRSILSMFMDQLKEVLVCCILNDRVLGNSKSLTVKLLGICDSPRCGK